MARLYRGQNKCEMTDLFEGKYRVPTVRAPWHNYDNGAYFVTICTHDRRHWFGEICDGVMHLTAVGRAAAECMDAIPRHCPYAEVGAAGVMPNHIHMIIFIDGNYVLYDKRIVETCHGTSRGNDVVIDKTCHGTSPIEIATRNKSWLSVVIGQYKSTVTRRAKTLGEPFAWQARFHEHIVTNQQSYETIAEYIENNVARWATDKMYT